MSNIMGDRSITRHLACCCEMQCGAAGKASNPWGVLLIVAVIVCIFPPTLLASSPASNSTAPGVEKSAAPQREKTLQLPTEGLTQQQGDAILQELRAIRQLLAKQRTPAKPRKRPTSAKIELGNNPSLGKADAPVTLVEFTDFQCPYCKRFHDTTFPKLREKYIDTGKLRYIAMDLPLKFHRQAQPAANAARCAAEQGKFWEMRKTLFEHSRALGQKELLSYAKELSLDMNAFQACQESNRHNNIIQQNIQTAHKAGFTGTPSFIIGKSTDNYVNGAALIGARPLAEFENHIQRLLPKTDGG